MTAEHFAIHSLSPRPRQPQPIKARSRMSWPRMTKSGALSARTAVARSPSGHRSSSPSCSSDDEDWSGQGTPRMKWIQDEEDVKTEKDGKTLAKSESGLLKSMDSVGSLRHNEGRCKPCAFFHTKGCNAGDQCLFCHRCPPHERGRRKRFCRRIRAKLLFDMISGSDSSAREAILANQRTGDSTQGVQAGSQHRWSVNPPEDGSASVGHPVYGVGGYSDLGQTSVVSSQLMAEHLRTPQVGMLTSVSSVPMMKLHTLDQSGVCSPMVGGPMMPMLGMNPGYVTSRQFHMPPGAAALLSPPMPPPMHMLFSSPSCPSPGRAFSNPQDNCTWVCPPAYSGPPTTLRLDAEIPVPAR
mmetsp:Transcript_124951/g.243242  ORF Transcript_124951/g.243242 Transcript_124951/m.243242 type:complete len:354 (-) Transcript_124951:233-1294(-)